MQPEAIQFQIPNVIDESERLGYRVNSYKLLSK